MGVGGTLSSMEKRAMILTLETAAKIRQGCILASGKFDLLHIGHVRYHKEASQLSDRPLVVAMTAGKHIHLPGRPVFSDEERLEMVDSLGCVDTVVLIHEPTMLTAIQELHPRYYAKGSETRREGNLMLDAECDAVRMFGGEVRFIGITCRYSSGALLRGDYMRSEITEKPL